MDKFEKHQEQHLLKRSNWLRAAVLGANDGILSTASIVTGVIAGGAEHGTVVLAGLAGLAAGAFSMATGEYVSVSSQSDIENADLKREKHELMKNPEYEQEELAHIYKTRGLTDELATEVAKQLMAHDAIGAHARDELGISEVVIARPIQAALSSAASFTLGAAIPLLTAIFAPIPALGPTVFAASLGSLVILGFAAAKMAGTPPLRPVLRVMFWGTISMGLTAIVGKITGSQM